jgi:hypothetical protein
MAASPDISKIDACVSCPMCSSEIPLPSGLRLPRQFSVRCPNCGQRKIHDLAEVHNRKDDAATQAFAEIQFGSKTDIRST